MSYTSRYLNINEYCLVEYIYSSGVAQETCNMYMVSDSISGTHHSFNSNSDSGITNNIEDYTVLPYGSNKYIHLDEENDIIQHDSRLVQSELITRYQSYYDSVRFHFINGMNLTAFSGLILSVKNTENDSTSNIFASILLDVLNYSDIVVFNPAPIYLSDRMYDRYVEVRIPSIKRLNTEYYQLPPDDVDLDDENDLTRRNTLAANITRKVASDLNQGFTGFISDYPITFSLDECNQRSTLSNQYGNYTLFSVSKHTEASIPQVNEYDLFGASIREATDGNYFLYNAVYGDSYPAEFINSLSVGTDKWVIIHQLNVYEYSSFGGSTMTSSMTTYQSDGFDEAQMFRPVLKNSGTAVGFGIDYMVRLLNQRTGEQIIRTASVDKNSNVNRYGKDTVAIKMLNDPSGNKVYNKVYKSKLSQSDLFIEPEFNKNVALLVSSSGATVVEKIIRYPMYVDFGKVSIIDRAMNSNNRTDSRMVFKQGDMPLLLKPFDTTFRFKIHDESNNVLVPMVLDSSYLYKMTFTLNSKGDNISQDYITDDGVSRLSDGDLSFMFPSNNISRILTSQNRNFYITRYDSSTTRENVMYHGVWFAPNEQQLFKNYISSLNTEYDTKFKSDAKVQSLVDSSISTSDSDIPKDVMIPGYVEQSSNKSEVSAVMRMKPRSV